MPKLLFGLKKQDSIFLIVSCSIFPFSLKAALLCFGCFLLIRILLFDPWEFKTRSQKLSYFIKIALSVVIVISASDFYLESRSHFYPVSYYDYLLVFVTGLIVKLFPLNKAQIKQVCLALSLSPIIVFCDNFSDANFIVRNNWGFDHSNALGLYCSLCIPLILCQLISYFYLLESKITSVEQIGKILPILLTLSLLLCSIMSVSSGSRSSLYTSFLIITVVVYLNFGKKLKKIFESISSKTKSNLRLFYSASFLLILGLIYKFVLTKFVFIGRFVNLTNSTNLYRTYVYKCYIGLGMEKPWWGWGIDKTAALCEQKLRARYGGVNHAHNFVLQLFADRGLIVTLCCLIGIVYFILIPTVKFVVSYHFAIDLILCLGIYLSSLSILIVSLFQSSFYHYPLFPIWLGLLWGIQLNFETLKFTK